MTRRPSGPPSAALTAGGACCSGRNRRASRVKSAAGLVGLCGSLACAAAMVLPVVGLAGVGAASGMASMVTTSGSAGSGHPGGALGFLVGVGPELLVVSAVLVVGSLAFRRRMAVLPATAAALLLYWGMYVQTNEAVMYATLVVAYLGWGATYLRVGSPRLRGRDQVLSDTSGAFTVKAWTARSCGDPADQRISLRHRGASSACGGPPAGGSQIGLGQVIPASLRCRLRQEKENHP